MGTDKAGLKRTKVEWVLVPLVLIIFLMLGGLSAARFYAFNGRAFDLGAMSQAIWRAGQGDGLIFTVEGIALSRLGRHVELFYFLLAPIYRLFPTPVTLLIFQAALFTAGAVPVYHLARRRLKQSWLALVVVGIYLFYPVAQTAVLFDFHGDTLAMPLLLFALEAQERRAWRSYATWLVLALSCKFYVAVPVAALGVVLWLQGEKRAGLWTTAAAVAWGAIAFFLIRPYFAPPNAVLVEGTVGSYVNYYFSQMNLALTGGLRLANGVIVFAPVLLLAARAPSWLLPGAAVILPVLISSGPGPSFDFRFHHYALGVPFLIAALIYGTAILIATNDKEDRHQKGRFTPAQLRLVGTLFFVLVLNGALVNTPLNPRFYTAPPGSGLGLDLYAGYKRSARDRFKEEWLAPLQDPTLHLAADRLLASRLTNRELLYLVPPENHTQGELLSQVDVVVVDGLYDLILLDGVGQLLEGGVTTVHETVRWLLAQPEWGVQRAADGLLQFGRGPGLAQSAELREEIDPALLLFQFGEEIGLVDAEIEQVGNGRYRLQFDWVALVDLAQKPPYLAVSRLKGVEHSRFVHLPTLGILSTTSWPQDVVVREIFEIELPPDLPVDAIYIETGWYDSAKPFAAETDGRSQMGENLFNYQLSQP